MRSHVPEGLAARQDPGGATQSPPEIDVAAVGVLRRGLAGAAFAVVTEDAAVPGSISATGSIGARSAASVDAPGLVTLSGGSREDSTTLSPAAARTGGGRGRVSAWTVNAVRSMPATAHCARRVNVIAQKSSGL